GSVTDLFDRPDQGTPAHLRLNDLGTNRLGRPVTALVIDTLFLCPSGLETFNVRRRTHHQQKFANTLYADGHASSLPNRDRQFTVDVRDYGEVRQAFEKILQVFEAADAH